MCKAEMHHQTVVYRNDVQNTFGEQQVRIVAENTLCFNKERVMSALHECGGRVDDATELLIPQMRDAESSYAHCAMNDTHDSVDATDKKVEDVCSKPVGLFNPTPGINQGNQQYGNFVSVSFEVHDNRIKLALMKVADPIVVQLEEPEKTNSRTVAMDSVTCGRVARRKPKRNKTPSSLPIEVAPRKPANNKPCPCKSGRRYKHCCKPKQALAPTATTSNVSSDRRLLVQLETLDI